LLVNNKNEDIFSIIEIINNVAEDYGYDEFIYTKGKGFIEISNRIKEIMNGDITDSNGDKIYGIEKDDFKEMAEAYFKTEFTEDVYKTPFHFLSNGIINVLFYRNCY
jgi:hypothetical protein